MLSRESNKMNFMAQVKKRRLELGLKQKDMMLQIGLSRQQYQHIESKGNPRLDIVELIAMGLNSELMLIPKEKVSVVKEVLEKTENDQDKNVFEDPWEDLLGGE